MKKGLFTGWRDVFAFTFKQDTKGKYKKTTVIFAVIMFIIGAAIPVIMAFAQKDDTVQDSPVATVHVVNESSLSALMTEQFETMNPVGFPDVKFVVETEKAVQVAEKLADCPKDLILVVSDTAEGFLLKAVIPENSELSEGDAGNFLSAFVYVAEVSKLVASGIQMDKLVVATSGSVIQNVEAGKDAKSEGEQLVATFLPMVVILFLYLILMIYGITMGNAVSAEKTSKLMEMILTMTRPNALVLGKILAMVVAAVVQVFVWFGSVVAGFFVGDYVAREFIFDGFNNSILMVFKLLKESDAGSAFSAPAIILFAVNLVISILFFSLLAATFGSFASKTEEVGQYMSYYQLLSIAGFLGSYILPLNAGKGLNMVLNIVPITSAYKLPADILVGNVTLLEGGLYLLLLAAFTVGLVFLVGKVYKNQLFFRGESGFKSFFKKAK